MDRFRVVIDFQAQRCLGIHASQQAAYRIADIVRGCRYAVYRIEIIELEKAVVEKEHLIRAEMV